MALLAALQPSRPAALMARWAEQEPARWDHHAQRLDEAHELFDPALKRELIDRVIAHLVALLRQAGERGVDLVLLPETCLPLGPCRPRIRERLREACDYAEPRWLAALAPLARQFSMVIASSYYRAEGERLYNDGVVVDADGTVAGIYHKVHLPCTETWEYTEAGLFEAGDEHTVIPTAVGRVGFQICYDIDFPEGSSALALGGADLILHPTVGYNFPDEEEVVAEARLRTRATDNSVPLIYSNFGPVPGRSAVYGANGAMLACAGRTVDSLAMAEVPLPPVRPMSWGGEASYPDHRQEMAGKRRPETYGILTRARQEAD
ncbi:MAG: carbon-nitrogen hydrolase family protein [Armatimonadetes bacterium]|nr:carbon-nitrogen hydrolase family protein [Armatimonadota bacterium]